MDIQRTEAVTALLKAKGWDISPNAYRHEYAGVFVSVSHIGGEVFINKSGLNVNADVARRMAAHLEAIQGIENVEVRMPSRGYAVTVTFSCDGFTGSATPSAATWGAATPWR
jgi:hypothetical protein